MPWASQKQRAYFYANPKLHRYIQEFNAATPRGARLPVYANSERLAKVLATRNTGRNSRG